jgi:hypothetical protein
MTTPLTASDIKATMKASLQQGMAAKEQTENAEPVTSLVGRPNVGPDKRFTVVLSNDQHRFVKRFAVDHNSDASTITRTLFTMLQSDKAFADLLLARIQEG